MSAVLLKCFSRWRLTAHTRCLSCTTKMFPLCRAPQRTRRFSFQLKNSPMPYKKSFAPGKKTTSPHGTTLASRRDQRLMLSLKSNALVNNKPFSLLGQLKRVLNLFRQWSLFESQHIIQISFKFSFSGYNSLCDFCCFQHNLFVFYFVCNTYLSVMQYAVNNERNFRIMEIK